MVLPLMDLGAVALSVGIHCQPEHAEAWEAQGQLAGPCLDQSVPGSHSELAASDLDGGEGEGVEGGVSSEGE